MKSPIRLMSGLSAWRYRRSAVGLRLRAAAYLRLRNCAASGIAATELLPTVPAPSAPKLTIPVLRGTDGFASRNAFRSLATEPLPLQASELLL